MSRKFQCLSLTRQQFCALREALKPYETGLTDKDREALNSLCLEVYRALYLFDADQDRKLADLRMSEAWIMFINRCVSQEDGDWALDLLHQTRQALYEMDTGREAIRLASNEDIARLMDTPVGKPREENQR